MSSGIAQWSGAHSSGIQTRSMCVRRVIGGLHDPSKNLMAMSISGWCQSVFRLVMHDLPCNQSDWIVRDLSTIKLELYKVWNSYGILIWMWFELLDSWWDILCTRYHKNGFRWPDTVVWESRGWWRISKKFIETESWELVIRIWDFLSRKLYGIKYGSFNVVSFIFLIINSCISNWSCSYFILFFFLLLWYRHW